MKLKTVVIAALAVVAAPVWAQSLEIPKTKYSMEQALQAVLAKYPGKVNSVELELKNGVPHYEFEIKTLVDGHEWEIECDANTLEITGAERDVEADDAAFTSVAKLSVADAMKIAVQKAPGMPTEVEYEVSPDGRAWYEFTITQAGGKSIEVMVDAATGQVIGMEDERDEAEVYCIGCGDD
jgi:uncharacterized membrane protein YkoI